MSVLVQIEHGEIKKTQAGKEYLLLNVVNDETGERFAASAWQQEHLSMWESGGFPPIVRLDVEAVERNGNTYYNIKDVIPASTQADVGIIEADVPQQTDPPEPELPFVNQPYTGPTRDDLFHGEGRGNTDPPAHRPDPPARRDPAPVPAQASSAYERSMALVKQPSFLEHAESVVPRGKSASRLIQVAAAAFIQNPQLLDCHPQSILNAVLNAVSLGLEVNTPLGEAYIVPFNSRNGKQAQFIPGYRGLVELMVRSGHVSHVQAFTVHEHDEFEHFLGSVPRHKRAEGDRGEIIGAWCLVTMTNGRQAADYMDVGEIDAIRDKSPGYKQDDSPWKTHYSEMARKTIVRRMAKMMPKSGGIQQALAYDDREEDEVEAPFIVEDEPPEPAAAIEQGTNQGGSVGAARAADFAGVEHCQLCGAVRELRTYEGMDICEECDAVHWPDIQDGKHHPAPSGGSDTDPEYEGPFYSSTGLLVQQVGPTTAKVESQSTEGRFYLCDFIAYTCTCPDAQFRFDQRAGGCKHISAAREVVGDQYLGFIAKETVLG